MKDEFQSALERVTDALERTNTTYAVVGSVAGMFHGLSRSTRNIDLVVSLDPESIPKLVDALKPQMYLDEDLALEALRRGSSFNLIDLDSTFKIDVFPIKPRAYDRAAFARRYADTLEGSDRTTFVLCVEDVVLSKLEWFELTERSSERQWGDILELLKLNGLSMDLGYARRWARELNLEGLLDQALHQAGMT